MKTTLLYILLLFSIFSTAQTRYYTNPMKIPLLLSGSFAELRSNHFHSGIDIKTQGVTGLPVYAVADGYISRIAVSPGGYGKALYIIHPNGTTSVYGHLSQFSPAVEKYVKDKQYEKESFRVDLQIPSFLFPVKQDEEIAKSGNTGSSGGPHLHFEIRDTPTEEPLNPLLFGFPVTDNIPPKVFSVLVVPLNKNSGVENSSSAKSYPAVFYDGKYHLKNNPTIPVWGEIGIAIQSNDYFDGSYNKCGINLLRMSVNEEEQFAFTLNRFSFSDTRYLNSHIDYGQLKTAKHRYVKTWLEPGNKLPIYTHNGTEGRILIEENQTDKIEIELQDSYKNTSLLSFSIVGKKQEPIIDSTLVIPFVYNRTNNFENDSARLSIPNGALYSGFNFEYRTEPASDEFFTDYHFFHNNTVPLHKNARFELRVDSLPEQLQSKVIMAYVHPVTGQYSAAGGTYKDGWVSTEMRDFGVYAVTVDTIPPEITPLSIADNKLTESNRIRFKIKDELAGIKTIEGLLDGKWALFEYDPRIATITHYFDKERFEMGKNHTFKLTITDYRNNNTVYEASFWK
ncbi:M23 family metallopeptidase [Draconibacterium sp. IB214405]|uniref:M23 family metallopeptidase n=1 Tax=Draconibacterium sp. IB214405 TaxID=3097352 RepID=UPI002A14DBA5|nr:M23 family metallopeptidase [Draconibacterium sp. IB214405]MDX8339848.1 M23 family metallopeptidase [Draconibacterium sp. IB214405]